MQELLEISLAFPTAVFTALLVLCVFFWSLMIVGGAGLDFFDVDLDFDVGGAEEAGSSIFELLSFFGVGTVPMSIFGSVVIVWGWILSVVSVHLLNQATTVGLLGAIGVFVAVCMISIPLSGVVVYPLKALFDGSSGCESGNEIIGGVCTISSSRVDAQLGRARFQTEGSELVISVRNNDENTLARGDEAVIIDFDDEENTYLVESVDVLFGDMEAIETVSKDVVLQNIKQPTSAKNVVEAQEKQRETLERES